MIRTVSAALVFGAFLSLALLARASDPASFKVAQAGRTAPEITGITNWLNSSPLTLSELRGKVVMVDFWTHGCINCVRTLPHVTKLYEKYKSRGLVVIGVHTPEFAFEKSTANVAAAIKLHNITYPVAQDNNFATWRAYSNRYWPAQYIVDKSGKVVFQHFGEEQYELIDQTVARLLNEVS